MEQMSDFHLHKDIQNHILVQRVLHLKTNSVWNVGAFDGYSADKQIRKGYGFKHPDYSIEPYLKLLTTRYLIEGKTEEELLDNFVDINGNRYASCEEYESKLRCKWNKMVSISEKI